uniref:Ribosomal protein S2 n=1 Tax=Peronospora tabacina TaxID=230439 RepID=A0A0N7ILH0_9STRA|nr:ribosomal protein S2 [Peronospora tabacina]ALJ78436.1 ribosomal protein S2 [Peronospora tabacina]ALJ78483.1 ribosomal protein S2 [Peronospora tabacina]
MIQKKKKNNNNVLLNLLFKSKNMFGESLTNTNNEILPFIYGSRYNRTIINLKNVSFVLKRIFKLINYITQKKNKILIIGNSDEIKFLFTTAFNKKNSNIIFFNQEWINGLITNKIKNTTFNKVINYLIKKKEIKLILIIKSSIKEDFLNQEIYTLKIPIISLINTSQTLKNINYPIVTNSKNIQSIYTLMYLLRKYFNK